MSILDILLASIFLVYLIYVVSITLLLSFHSKFSLLEHNKSNIVHDKYHFLLVLLGYTQHTISFAIVNRTHKHVAMLNDHYIFLTVIIYFSCTQLSSCTVTISSPWIFYWSLVTRADQLSRYRLHSWIINCSWLFLYFFLQARLNFFHMFLYSRTSPSI